MMFQKW